MMKYTEIKKGNQLMISFNVAEARLELTTFGL